MIKNYSTALFVGVLVTLLEYLLKSNYMVNFLSSNLVNLQVAILAINGATLSIVLTRLKELTERHPVFPYKNVLHAIMYSIKEMVVLIAMAILVCILNDSARVRDLFLKKYIIESLQVGIFCYTLYLLYDCCRAIFILLGFDEKRQNNDSGN